MCRCRTIADERAQWPSAEEVHMQVRHRLARIRAMIDDQAVSRCRHAEIVPEACGDNEQMAQHLLMRRIDIGDRRDRLDRHDEEMHGCLWLNVSKGDAELIAIDDVRRYVARDNPAEEGRLFSHAHRHPRVWRR